MVKFFLFLSRKLGIKKIDIIQFRFLNQSYRLLIQIITNTSEMFEQKSLRRYINILLCANKNFNYTLLVT